MVAGSELWLSTVMVRLTGIRRNGTVRGRERRERRRALVDGGAGLGKAGNGGSDTPAGTYSSAAALEPHSSPLQALPPATRMVPSSRSVNERGPASHPNKVEAVVHYRSAAVQADGSASPPTPPVTSTVPFDKHRSPVSNPLPGLTGRAVQVPVAGSYTSADAGSHHHHLVIGLQEGRPEHGLRVHVRDRGPGPRDRVVYLGRVHIEVVHAPPEAVAARNETLPSDSRTAGAPAAARSPCPLPGGGPGPAGRVVHLRPRVQQNPAISEHREHVAQREVDPEPSARWRSRSRWPGRTPGRRHHWATRTKPSRSIVNMPPTSRAPEPSDRWRSRFRVAGSYTSAPLGLQQSSPTTERAPCRRAARWGPCPTSGFELLPVASQVPVAGS